MNRKILIGSGAGAIAVFVIAYVAFFSPSPQDADLAGAIGAAKVHRADQITDADVVLQDPEIQDLLQSEFFYKLATDDAFRRMAIDQLARLDIAAGRSLQFTSAASLQEMKAFLDLAAGNGDLRLALAEGRLNVVADILAGENRLALLDVANRIYFAEGRQPQLNIASLQDMRAFVEQALGNAELRVALAEGRLDRVQDILAAGRLGDLAIAAQRVYLAEGRQPQLAAAGVADMRVLMEVAVADADLRAALAEGRLDRVNDHLAASNRHELISVANRLFLTQERGAQIEAAAFGDMKAFLDLAMSSPDLRVALFEGRLERVQDLLAAEGRTDLQQAAQRLFLADRRQPQIAVAGLTDLKAFLDLAADNPDLRVALAEGRMNVVSEILAGENRLALADAAGRLYLAQGRSPQLNAAALTEMRSFLELALGNQDLRLAMAEGRIASVEQALISDGRTDMCVAANRVHLAENRHPELMRDASLGNLRAITSFASENPEFRTALQENRLDMAARMALAAGKHDISLRSLQMANFVLGRTANVAVDLNRIVAVAESPAYRAAIANPGWGRLVASADAASWRQTIDTVRDGRLNIQR